MPAGKDLMYLTRFVIIRLGSIVTKYNNSLYFQLDEPPSRCAAKEFKCPAGREYCPAEGQYAMIYCHLCGSESIHKHSNGRPYFRCNACTDVKDRNDNDRTSVSHPDFNQDDCTDDDIVSSDDEQLDGDTSSDCTDSDNSIMDPSVDRIACSVHMRPGKIRLRLASSSSSNDLDIVYRAGGKGIRMTII